VGIPILTALGKAAYFEDFSQRYNEWGIWVVLMAGMTPFPYKVITIMSGATALSLPVFILSSFAARGLRFFIVAALLWKFGDPIRIFIEKRLGLVFTIFLVHWPSCLAHGRSSIWAVWPPAKCASGSAGHMGQPL
jgi:membrane protein DedA with SNARE-associated domain